MNFTSWECMAKYLNGTLPAQTTCLYTYPGFASNIIFELYEDANKKPFIKALYNGTAMPLCQTQNTYCYLDTFSTLINNFVVSSFDEECGNIPSTSDSVPTWAIIVMSVFGALIVVLVVLAVFLRTKMVALKKVTSNSAYSQI